MYQLDSLSQVAVQLEQSRDNFQSKLAKTGKKLLLHNCLHAEF